MISLEYMPWIGMDLRRHELTLTHLFNFVKSMKIVWACYPIFFPYGTSGWSREKYPDISILKYYRFLIYERKYSKNHILKGFKLSQQFWCDAYAKIDQIRLSSFKTKTAQRKLTKHFISGQDKDNINDEKHHHM